MNKRSKVLAIGLDGADPDILYELSKKGYLSTLRGLVQKGVSGRLKSTIPPSTCPAWVSSVTGVNIGKHGIHDFCLSVNLEKKQISFANSTRRKAKAIWNIASDFDKKCVILNVPVTYPPERINGIIVSGMLTPSSKSEFTYPRNLKDEIIDLGYEIDIGGTLIDKLLLHERDEVAMLFKIKELVRRRTILAEHLMRESDWDLFMVVYVALDRIHHLYWKYIDPKHVSYNSAAAKRIYFHILEVYVELDRAIASLLKAAGRNVHTVIYSDHGFKPVNRILFTNSLFRKMGLLKLRRTSMSRFITRERVMNIALKTHLESLVSKLPADIVRRFGKTIQPSEDFANVLDVDPAQTKAFHFGYNYVRFNANCISENEEDSIRRQILDLFNRKLSSLLIKAYTPEDLYHGPMVKEVPQIILHSEGDVTLRALIPFDSRTLVEYDRQDKIPAHKWNGDHDLYGVLVLASSNSRYRYNQQTVKDACITDIAPTILRFLGIPSSSYMDGKPLITSQKNINEFDG